MRAPRVAPPAPISRPVQQSVLRPQEADTTGEQAPLTNEDVISIILGTQRSSGGGGGTFTGETTPQRLAREASERGAYQQQRYLQDLIGAIPGQYQSLIGGVEQTYAPAREYTQSQYEAALQALTGRRTQAEQLAAQGQQALQTYLQTNAQRAFAGTPQATAASLTPSSVAQYAQAIGVPTSAIGSAQVEAATQSQGAVDAYNRLLSNLQASEASQNASRLAELEMLRNVQGAGIQQLYGAGSQQLEAQRQAALNAIAQQQANQVFALQQAQLAREQALRDAMLQLYGSGAITYQPGTAAPLPDLSGVDWNALGRLLGMQ
jgi:hypothetical protein